MPNNNRRPFNPNVANFQSSLVRLRHHLTKRRKTRTRRGARKLRTIPFFRILGEQLYLIGFHTEYAGVKTVRAAKKAGRFALVVLNALSRLVYGALSRVGGVLLRDVGHPVAVFFLGIVHAFRHADEVRREKGLVRAVAAGIRHFAQGIKRNVHLLPRTLSYLVPLAAAAACFVFINTTLNSRYALAVTVPSGDTGTTQLGYISTESVFENAKTDVNDRLNYADADTESWDIEPTYTITRLSSNDKTSGKKQIADAILEASSDEIAEATALYIDGSIAQISDDGTALQSFLDELKAPYEAAANENTVVQFNHTVELVDGVFFTKAISTENAVEDYVLSDQVLQKVYTVVAGDSLSLIASKNGLTQAELYSLNSDIGLSATSAIFPGDELIVVKQEKVLEVQTVETVNYDEAIPYSTETTSSSDYDFGTTKTIQEGVDGIANVTAEITRDADGNVISNIITSRVTTLEPVTKKVVRGTRLASGSVAQVGSGTLMWPVPGYRYVSRWMSSSHKGCDICAPAGTPIYASDSGVVIKCGYSAAGSGYGNSIVINHGNGVQTLYAHCLTLNVSVGQSVSQGQLIGTVGSTGRSTGNHCHYEIFINGTRVSARNYFPNK